MFRQNWSKCGVNDMIWDEAEFQRKYRSTDWNFREYPKTSPASMAFYSIVRYIKWRSLSESRKAARSDISVLSSCGEGNQRNWYNRSKMYCDYSMPILFLITVWHGTRRKVYEIMFDNCK